jgi:hypothetical protein
LAKHTSPAADRSGNGTLGCSCSGHRTEVINQHHSCPTTAVAHNAANTTEDSCTQQAAARAGATQPVTNARWLPRQAVPAALLIYPLVSSTSTGAGARVGWCKERESNEWGTRSRICRTMMNSQSVCRVPLQVDAAEQPQYPAHGTSYEGEGRTLSAAGGEPRRRERMRQISRRGERPVQ